MKMKKWRGLHLRRLPTVWRCARLYSPINYFRRGRSRLSSFSPSRWSPIAITRKLFAWSCRRRLLTRCHSNTQPLLREEEVEKPGQSPPTPKGHLVVYVTECSGWGGGGRSPRRYVVPLIYFNHPLFEELLKEAVEEFGYDQPGGITLPCPVERFERVKDRIAACAANYAGRRRFEMKSHQ